METMAYKGTTKTPFRKMYIKGKYEDFTDFYAINKRPIYENIIEVFKGFTGDSKKRVLTLYIQAIIQGLEWDTEFKFNKSDTIVLLRDVIPYFEEIEEYEICEDVKKLHEELTSKK